MAINHVSGNARVGIQGQNIVISGGVHMGKNGLDIQGTVITTEDDDQGQDEE